MSDSARSLRSTGCVNYKIIEMRRQFPIPRVAAEDDPLALDGDFSLARQRDGLDRVPAVQVKFRQAVPEEMVGIVGPKAGPEARVQIESKKRRDVIPVAVVEDSVRLEALAPNPGAVSKNPSMPFGL